MRMCMLARAVSVYFIKIIFKFFRSMSAESVRLRQREKISTNVIFENFL